ncbi:MAG: hypothetical protein V7L14_04065 [Nostoc sp.]
MFEKPWRLEVGATQTKKPTFPAERQRRTWVKNPYCIALKVRSL